LLSVFEAMNADAFDFIARSFVASKRNAAREYHVNEGADLLGLLVSNRFANQTATVSEAACLPIFHDSKTCGQ
jgi:hypothetical protein